MIVENVRWVPTALKWKIARCLNFYPSFFSEIVDPKIVQLLRIVILSTKYIHVAIMNRCRMTASGAWYGLTRGDFDVFPLVCSEVVNRGLVSPIALLEATKNYHLRRLNVDNTWMFVSKQHLLASRSDQRPRHGPQIQIMQLVTEDLLRVSIFLSATWWCYVTSKEVHVVLVYARTMIGDLAWDVGCVTCRLHLSPAEVTLDGITARTVQFILIDLAQALQTEFKEWV